MSFKFHVGESFAVRPYSISSAPFEARDMNGRKGFIEITVKKKSKGFITQYIWDNWKKGFLQNNFR